MKGLFANVATHRIDIPLDSPSKMLLAFLNIIKHSKTFQKIHFFDRLKNEIQNDPF